MMMILKNVSCVLSFRIDDLQRIATEAFDEIGPDRWTQAYDHVKKVVEQTQANDFFIEKPLLLTWHMKAILVQMTLTAANNSCCIISFIEICF